MSDKIYRRFTTKVQTADGKIWDLGERDYPPTHYHDKDGRGHCPQCLVVNAWPEEIGS